MIGAEWSGVFPLRVNCSIALVDCDPSIFASRNSGALVCLLKPRHDARRFWAMASRCLVAVRKRAIKRILPGRKFCGNVIAPACGIGVVKTPVAFGPIFVPGTRAI